MKIISKIAWIHIEDRKVLMVRTRGKDTFYFPGGKPEKLESNAQALERELREELEFDLAGEVREFANFEFDLGASGKGRFYRRYMEVRTAPERHKFPTVTISGAAKCIMKPTDPMLTIARSSR